MTLTQKTLDELRSSTGSASTLGDDDTPPYGYTCVGAAAEVQRIAKKMDKYGMAFSDLPAEKQNDFEKAHEALQFHIKNLSNLIVDDMVGVDGSIELPNGNTIDLPKQATSGDRSKNLPAPPK